MQPIILNHNISLQDVMKKHHLEQWYNHKFPLQETNKLLSGAHTRVHSKLNSTQGMHRVWFSDEDRGKKFNKWVNMTCSHDSLDGLQLDKNLWDKDNKFYSPDRCILIPAAENGIMKFEKKQDDRPLGLIFKKDKNGDYWSCKIDFNLPITTDEGIIEKKKTKNNFVKKFYLKDYDGNLDEQYKAAMQDAHDHHKDEFKFVEKCFHIGFCIIKLGTPLWRAELVFERVKDHMREDCLKYGLDWNFEYYTFDSVMKDVIKATPKEFTYYVHNRIIK